MSRGLRLFITLLLIIGGLAALFILNPTAREVTVDALGLAFAFFSTPFILETTCALLFLIGLLAYNRWRLHKEGDGWVWLMTQEPDAKNLPATITQRLQSTVLESKPEPVDEAQAEAGVIEGYLELGMAAQALGELREDTTPHPPLEAVLLRIRVLAANLEMGEATRLLHDTALADVGACRVLAAISLENARWLLKHLHREDLARHWLDQARKLDTRTIEDIARDEPLHQLL